jgi:pimeloyl-ACP methyl ester carboxylesterase
MKPDCAAGQKRKRFLTLLASVGLLTGCMLAAPEPKADPVREMDVQSPGATLHIRVAGNLAAEHVLIAIHGGPGMSSDYMLSLEQLANERRAVITYDQRGTGQSTEPSDGYAMEKYVEDLDAVRQAVDAETIDLFGHSWGGLVAQQYAIAHPDRVRSIVLMGSGAPSMQAMRAANEHKVQHIAELQQQGIIPTQINSIDDMLPAYYADPHFDAHAELQSLYYNGNVEQQTWAEVGNYDFAAGVATLTHPILLLWGDGDPFGVQMAKATQDALLNAKVEFVLLEGCGHFWHECPDEFYPRVHAFLESVEH